GALASASWPSLGPQPRTRPPCDTRAGVGSLAERSDPRLQLRRDGSKSNPDATRSPCARIDHLAVDFARRVAQGRRGDPYLQVTQEGGPEIRSHVRLERRDGGQPALVHGPSDELLLENRESDWQRRLERGERHPRRWQRQPTGLTHGADLVQDEAPRGPLRLDLIPTIDAQGCLDLRSRVLGNEELTPDGEGLDAPGEIHVDPHNGVLRTTQRADVAHDDAPGVHTDAHFELYATLRSKALVHLRHRELHGQPARDRLLGMVVACYGGAKDHEHGVTDDLVDYALVTFDDIHHGLEIDVEDVDDFLRAEARGHGREPPQARHQNAALTPLSTHVEPFGRP